MKIHIELDTQRNQWRDASSAHGRNFGKRGRRFEAHILQWLADHSGHALSQATLEMVVGQNLSRKQMAGLYDSLNATGASQAQAAPLWRITGPKSVGPWTLWLSEGVTMALSPQPSALSPQPSALSPQPSALSQF